MARKQAPTFHKSPVNTVGIVCFAPQRLATHSCFQCVSSLTNFQSTKAVLHSEKNSQRSKGRCGRYGPKTACHAQGVGAAYFRDHARPSPNPSSLLLPSSLARCMVTSCSGRPHRGAQPTRCNVSLNLSASAACCMQCVESLTCRAEPDHVWSSRHPSNGQLPACLLNKPAEVRLHPFLVPSGGILLKICSSTHKRHYNISSHVEQARTHRSKDRATLVRARLTATSCWVFDSLSLDEGRLCYGGYLQSLPVPSFRICSSEYAVSQFLRLGIPRNPQQA